MNILLTLTIVAVALILFVAEWFPADITAIIVMVLLMITGLITPDEGMSGFSNSATTTVLAMFILSAGITRTGAVQIVSVWLQRWGRQKLSRQIVVLGVILAPISAFINNTAVVAVFLPIVEDWCRKQGMSPSKLLMPLSYITVLGGMITLIGTSTNIVASGMAEQLGYEPFGLFQFTLLGLSTCAIGLIYLALVVPRLIPDRKPIQGTEVLQSYGLREYVSEIVIPPGSSLIGQTLASSQIQRRFDMDVLELIRNNERFPQPFADKSLQGGDILLVRGKRECLLSIKEEKGIRILPEVEFGSQDSLTTEEEGIAEVLILSNADLVGSTLKDIRFRQRYNATVLAIQRGEEVVRDRMGRVPLKFGDVLLLQGPKQSLLGLQGNPGLIMANQQDIETFQYDKAWLSVAIVLGVILVAAFDWMPILISAWVGVVLMIVSGCLKPGELYTAVRWDIIFLLAGLIPLGVAMDKSGASQWLADGLLAIGGNLSGFWILLMFYILTSIVTEILSNNACVVLMLPIAVKVAESLSLNPYAFMFAVTFAASNSFMTPIGYQTNTMVYGPGGYKFTDFLRVGGPLNLILTLVTPPLIVLYFGL